MSYQQPGPWDQPQAGQQPTQPYPPQQPYYQQPQPGYGYPPPVQVNVVQNAGYGAVAVRQRINHGLHWMLIIFTGGLWLFVYIPMCMKRRKVVVYR